ncbi:MAG: ATPase, T2SS/T4P/T4SS family [Candidatus Aphodocola sp.]
MKNEFTQVDFGPIQAYLDNDDITDISYSNGGQVWLKTLSKGVYRVQNPAVNNAFMEKMAFQCANSMGKSFNMANPFLDAESAELRMNFVHDSIAKNGIAVLIRKTPAKIRLEKDKIIKEDYIRLDIHDFLLKCVEGHCNILVSGETGSGKTEFVKYMAAHTKYNEKLITIEDTLELHLDRIFPERDIVAMKTNNIASYADVLVTCMRQNPRWILLSEVRSAEAVMAVRDSISSGHNILSTIHADKAESIPSRLYSLLESSIDMDQFLRSIHRYVQLGVHIKGYYSPELQRFKREVAEVVEFYVTENNQIGHQIIYKRTPDGKTVLHNPTKYLLGYLESQGVIMEPDILVKEEFHPAMDSNIVSGNSEVLNIQSDLNNNVTDSIVNLDNDKVVGADSHFQNYSGFNTNAYFSSAVQNDKLINTSILDPTLTVRKQTPITQQMKQSDNTINNNYLTSVSSLNSSQTGIANSNQMLYTDNNSNR